MCFHYAYIADKYKTIERYELEESDDFEPVFHANAFSNLKMPVITNEEPKSLNFYNWGLIPFWIKTKKDVDGIRNKTGNARSETIFEKPSFKFSIKKKRCLIPASGFYEWRHEEKEKIPHYVYLKNQDIFSFGGIWEKWTDKETGEIINSFSIITTKSNKLMSYVHNNRERMPLILKQEDENIWLSDLEKDEIKHLFYQIPSKEMEYKKIDTKRIGEWLYEKNN